jgi:Fe-S-cluster-containing dehydrogenase component
VCPTKTRRFGDLKDENDAIRELIHNELTNVLKPDLNTEPFCFYIGFDRAIR